MNSARRNAAIAALLLVFGAGAAFRFNGSFVLAVSLILMAIWSAVLASPTMDSYWRWKTGFVVALMAGTGLLLWPTLHSMSGGAIPLPGLIRDNVHAAVVKGLDLQGGMRLMYTVEVEEAIREKRDNYAEQMRRELAIMYGFHTGDGAVKRENITKLDEKVRVSTPADDAATLRVKFVDAGDVSKIDQRFVTRFQAELGRVPSTVPGEVPFKILSEVETQIRETAVQQAKDTIGRRVDELGLKEASVATRDEDIIIEVPGNDKAAFDEIKETIRRTARLEFKMVDDDHDFFGTIKDNTLPEGQGLSVEGNVENAPTGAGKTASVHYARMVKREGETLTQTRERLKAWAATLPVPDDHQIGFEALREFDEDTMVETEIGWRTLYLYRRADVTGEYITDARTNPPSNNSPSWAVGVTFTPAGAERMEELSTANIKRRMAIILDDTVNSAPVIQEKLGSNMQVTLGGGSGDRQRTDARKLELVLKSGALPAPITPSNETLIGPTLGEDAIRKGVTGALFGSGLVLLFMVAYYRKAGFVADLAVLFNLALQLAVLATFGATMTLPGIAGLALTIGMAVDANVLINERIREELRAGRTVRAAVDAGYDRAMASIIDGHVTVFISGLILAQLGTGPVKGFAITLIVGIVASLFTGVVCTRLVFDWWVRGARVKTLSVGITVPPQTPANTLVEST